MNSGHDKFNRLPLHSPDRPIRVVSSVDIDIPGEAGRAKKFLNPELDKVAFQNGNQGYHWRVKIPEGVMVAHVDSDETVAFVDNYRHPLGRYSRELPGGGFDPEETIEFENASPEERELLLKQAAIREFREEIGLHLGLGDVKRLLPTIQGSVGFADLSYNIFHGEGGVPAEQVHDDGEAGMLTSNRYSISDATEMIGHEIVDVATTTAVMALALEYGVRVEKRLQRLSNDRVRL